MTSSAFSRTQETFRVFCLVAGLIIITQIKLSQPSMYSAAYLFSDESHNFLVADVLLQDKVLYKDIFYVYGYLSAYSYTLAALIFGNSISTYLHFLQAISILSVVAIYAMLRSCVSGMKALLTTMIAVVPQTIIPGSLSAGITDNTYHPLETGIIAICVLLWRPAGTQSFRRAFLLGVTLGLWQGVKFGGAFVFGLALVLAEIIYLSTKGFEKALVRDWLHKSLITLSGFLLIQGVWCVIAFATLPPEMARDVLFPSYMLETYAGSVSSLIDRYPHFISWRYFLSIQLGPLAGLVGAVWFIVNRVIRPAKRAAPDNRLYENCQRLLILPIFFGIGCFVYFKQVWLYYAYAWALTVCGVYLLIDARKFGRLIIISIWVVGFAAFCKNGLLVHQEPDLVSLVLPNGEKLWVEDKTRERVDKLINFARVGDLRADASPTQGPQAVVFYPMGAGMHTFYGIPRQGRHYWFLPGAVRPYDEDAIVNSLDHTRYWIVLSDDANRVITSDPETWDGFKIKPFSPSLRARIAERLSDPIRLDELTYAFPVKGKS